MSFLIDLAQSVVRINPGQGQNDQTFGVSLVSVKSIEKVTSTGNRLGFIVTGGKRRYSVFKEYEKITDFSNLLSDPMVISLLIYMHFISLNRPQNQLLSGI